MQTITRYLSNPYVMAALVGLGVYMAAGAFDSTTTLGSSPMVLALGAVVVYIAYKWWKRDMPLPIVGTRAYPMPSQVPMQVSTQTASVLPPEQFGM